MNSMLPALAFAAVVTAQVASVIMARVVMPNAASDQPSAPAMRVAETRAEYRP